MRTEPPTLHTGLAAGVPFVVAPPPSARTDAPVVVAWHLLAPPRSERALAAALPLTDVDAWRVYLGLPMAGSRLPGGDPEALLRLHTPEPVLDVYEPITSQAVDEFPNAYTELRKRFGFAETPAALLGGSTGGAIAASVPIAHQLRVEALVFVNALLRLRPAIDEMSAFFGTPYEWSERSAVVAERLDFVDRADELAALGEPATLLVLGADDLPEAFHRPAEALRDALTARYADPDRVRLVTVPGMAHPFADEPGLDPAPQTAHARLVEDHVTAWLRRYLRGNRAPS